MVGNETHFPFYRTRLCYFIFLQFRHACHQTGTTHHFNIPRECSLLAGLYNCAGGDIITAEQMGADFLDPQSVDMVIRIGQPGNPNTFAYQIGIDKLMVITNLKNPTNTLTADQVHGLFTGQIPNWKTVNGSDAPVDAWVFPAGEDIQEIITQTILEGSLVSSGARLANNPDEMLQAIEKDVNAVGIIPSRWKNGNISGYTLPLAIFWSWQSPLPNHRVLLLTSSLACKRKLDDRNTYLFHRIGWYCLALHPILADARFAWLLPVLCLGDCSWHVRAQFSQLVRQSVCLEPDHFMGSFDFMPYPIFYGVFLLRTVGKPTDQLEATTHLVTNGIYQFIRHPLYASLIYLTWGIFFKSPTMLGGCMAVVSTAFYMQPPGLMSQSAW